MTRFERIEAARQARDSRDYTAPASVERPSAPFAFKGSVVHRHVTARVVSDDGLRFEYAGTRSALEHFPRTINPGPRRGVAAGQEPERRLGESDGDRSERRPRLPGFAAMSPERRYEISQRANAARHAKVSAKRRSQIAAKANAARWAK